MNRRSFFKMLTGFAGGVFAVFVPKAKADKPVRIVQSMKAVILDSDAVIKMEVPDTEFICNARCNCLRQYLREVDGRVMVSCEHHPPYYINEDGTNSDCVWKFYINGEEVDSSRAVNENGGITWPFQGAKKGDLCMAKSPMLSIYPRALKPTEIKKLWNS